MKHSKKSMPFCASGQRMRQFKQYSSATVMYETARSKFRKIFKKSWGARKRITGLGEKNLMELFARRPSIYGLFGVDIQC